jgi:hypothetical protein
MGKVIKHHSLTSEQRQRKQSQVRTLALAITIGLVIIILVVSLVATQTKAPSSDPKSLEPETQSPSMLPSLSSAPSVEPSPAPSSFPSSSPTITFNRNETTTMAERRLFCNSNNPTAFPHVLEQCQCQGAINIIPEDVLDVRQEYSDHLMPFIYNRDDVAAIFEDPSSCSDQNIALLWLASGSMRQEGDLAQRYILSLFFVSTTGDDWARTFGWWTPMPECQWLGVSCDSSDSVTSLELNANDLAGRVSNLTKGTLYDDV